MNRVGDKISCSRCGEPIVRTAPGRKYCDACAAEVHREKTTERNRSRRGESRKNYSWNYQWAARRAAERQAERARILCCGAKDAPTYVYARIQRGGEAVVVEVRGQPSFRLADLVDRRLARKQGKD